MERTHIFIKEDYMSHQKKSLGLGLATVAAAMFISGAAVTMAPSAAEAAGDVKCMGLNSCKGHGECKTAANDCKGMNACKGQGWMSVGSAKECTDKGGQVKM